MIWLSKLVGEFKSFYPHYMKGHDHPGNRKMHFAGATSFFALTIISLVTLNPWLLFPAVFLGYFFPHIGHKHIQKNESMKFSSPVFCVVGAFFMYINEWKHLFRKLAGLGSEKEKKLKS